jgi:type II secretory pathway predicted ATPase ExeA
MYEDFFGLKDRPFAITPSADLYFDSSVHRRTLAYLRCGVSNGDSLLVMTGEIGAGKTTLLQTLMRDLEADRVVPATLSNTQLDAAGVTESILFAFGAPLPDRSTGGLEAALDAHLSKLGAAGRRGLAIVDEAQNLPPDALRQLLHLSTARPAAGAPLQLLLSGQPGLRGRLLNTAMDEIVQPVCLFCHVGPLDGVETRSYIEHRLQRLGAAGAPAFSAAAFEAIHRATGGIPRRINRLCDRVLLAAYLANRRDIDDQTVAKVDADLRQEFGDPEATSLARRSAADAMAAAPTARVAASTEADRADVAASTEADQAGVAASTEADRADVAASTEADRADVAASIEADRADVPRSSGANRAPAAESAEVGRSSAPDPDEILGPPAAEPGPTQASVAEKAALHEPALEHRPEAPIAGDAEPPFVSREDVPAPSRVASGAWSGAEGAEPADAAATRAPASFAAPPRRFETAPVRVRRRRSRTLFLGAILFAVALSAGGWFVLERRPSLARDLRAWWTEASEATRAVAPSARRSSGELTTVRPERPGATSSGDATGPEAQPQRAAPVADPAATAGRTPAQPPRASVRPEAPKPSVASEAPKPPVRSELPKPTTPPEAPKPAPRMEAPRPAARAAAPKPARSEAPSPPQPAPAVPMAPRGEPSAQPPGPPPARDRRAQPPPVAQEKPQPSATTPSCTEAMSALGLCR